LKEIVIEPKGIYQRARIRTGAIFPIDYNSLARGIETDDEQSAIVGSYSSNSYRDTKTFTYMPDIP